MKHNGAHLLLLYWLYENIEWAKGGCILDRYHDLPAAHMFPEHLKFIEFMKINSIAIGVWVNSALAFEIV